MNEVIENIVAIFIFMAIITIGIGMLTILAFGMWDVTQYIASTPL